MLTATKILANVDQKYQGCSNYADAGSVFQWDHGAVEPQKAELTFKTYFVRPDKLRVEWTRNGNLDVIWSNGTKHRALFTFEDHVEECDDVAALVAGATGVSMGVAFLIPTLLLPTIREEANHLLKVMNPLLDEFQAAGRHYCISAQAQRANDSLMWISEDFTIQAVREETVMSADECRLMVEEAHAMMNEPIDEDMTFTDSHYFQKTVYEKTLFDSDIDPALFDYSP